MVRPVGPSHPIPPPSFGDNPDDIANYKKLENACLATFSQTGQIEEWNSTIATAYQDANKDAIQKLMASAQTSGNKPMQEAIQGIYHLVFDQDKLPSADAEGAGYIMYGFTHDYPPRPGTMMAYLIELKGAVGG